MSKNDSNKLIPTPIAQRSTFTGGSWEDPAGPPYRGVCLLARDTSAQLILCGQAEGRRWAEVSNQSLYCFSYLTTNTRHLESWHSQDLLCPWVVLEPERSAPSGSRTSSKHGSTDESLNSKKGVGKPWTFPLDSWDWFLNSHQKQAAEAQRHTVSVLHRHPRSPLSWGHRSL